jgi:catechol 2,3-dioxygenase-like lactoylglutathione lyase family enzyme
MTTTTVPFTLTGQSLINYVDERKELIARGELSRTEMIKDAGYVYDNGKARYVDFYTELLNARGVTPVTNRDVEDNEYDALNEDEKALYDYLDEQSFTEKWDHEEFIEFLVELKDNGIETVSSFEDAFYSYNDEYWAERHFAEEFVNEVESIQDSIVYHAIDWQAVWDHQLRYDFCTIEHGGWTFFFRNY